MSVSTAYTPDTYQGDGLSTAFPITFPYMFYSDLVLSTTVVATGVVTPLVYGTNYTILPLTNSPADTGTATLLVALPTGTDLTIDRSTPITQLTVWTPNDPNPTSAIQNATDKLTLIAQELQAEIDAIPDSGGGGGGGNVVTTANFTIAAIGVAQTVNVTSATGFAAGNIVRVSNSALTMFIAVTGTTATSLTGTTSAITAGSAGSTMPTGSAVQLGQVPNTTTITAADDSTPPTPVSGFLFTGDPGIAGDDANLFLSIVGGVATIGATIPGVSLTRVSAGPIGLGIAGFPASGSALGARIAASTASGVLKANAGLTAITFGLLDATNITAGSLTPALLNATNAPTDTFVPTYHAATQQFTWAAGGSGSLPGGGNAGTFLVGGTPAWSQWLNTSLGDGAFFFGNSGATNAYSGFLTQTLAAPAGFNISIDIGVAKYNGSNWLGANNGVFKFWGAIAAKVGGIGAYASIDASNVEVAQFGSTTTNFISDIVRAGGFRAGAGYWQYAFTLNAPGASVTVDLKNGSYQRHTGIANNVNITLADGTPAPTAGSYQYANVLTLEINAPGIFTYTFPGTVTWANGGSAPTLNTSGINVIRFVRRQGQTQWIGYVEGGTFSLTAGIINSASYFAAGVIPLAALSATGSPSSSTFLRGDNTWATPSGSILATNNGVTISGGPFTTLQFGANITGVSIGGGVLGIAAAGGSSSANNAPYNVKLAPFNAFGNGVADDTAAVQNAINTAAAAGGGTVYFPAGTYKITSSLTMSRGINLVGDGIPQRNAGGALTNSITTIKWAGAAAGVMLSLPGSIGGLTMYGLLFDGSSIAGKGWYFEVLSNSLIEHCYIANCTTYGMHISVPNVDDCTANKFSNLYIYTPAATCIKIEAQTNGHNACHNTFTNLFLDHGNRAIDMNWSDNNAFYQTFCFRAAGTNYDIVLRGDSPVVGVGASGTRFYQLEGEIEAQAVTSGSVFFNEVYGYDQGNGQRSPLINTGAKLSVFGIAIVAETVSGHSNLAAVSLYQGQAICLAPPTGANTGAYIQYNGSNIRASKDGGNTWTNLV